MQHEPGLAPGDVVLGLTTLSFDISVLEVFLPLMVGAEVVIASRDDAMDGARLAALIRSCGATMVQATPTTWWMLFEAGWTGDPSITVLCGGEAMAIDLARRLVGSCGAVWNMFGPTETTVWSTVFRVTEAHTHGTSIPIGRPIAGTDVPGARRRRRTRPDRRPRRARHRRRGRRPRLPPAARADRRALRRRSVRARPARSTAPATWPAGGPTARSSSSAGSTTRSRCAATASSSARSSPRCAATRWSQDAVVVADGSGPAAQLVAYVIATDRPSSRRSASCGSWLKRRLPEYMVPSPSCPSTASR